ncbi:protein YIF1B [Selaginella moellendorffii]|nr:protein YIF1B [Selaginella moellendorffii]|eukprot:XP_002988500.2 protein YIF1B [Selaginella moellendorffii]
MAWQQQQPPRPMQPYGYNNFVPQPGMPGMPPQPPPGSGDSAFYNSDLIRTGLGAYGEKLFGSSKDYVQSNISRFLAGQDIHYYFQLNEQYVKNKLKIILFPFLHKGHWTRIAEQVAGGITYKPPRYDINAPDLYIPLMALATYVVLRCYALGFTGKFSPAVMQSSFSHGIGAWLVEVILVKGMLFAVGSGEVPWLDTLAYSGYSLVGMSLSIAATISSKYLFYFALLWTGICMGVFLVKTLKRVFLAEVRSYERDSSKHHYLLLFVAIAQVPIFLWFTRL